LERSSMLPIYPGVLDEDRCNPPGLPVDYSSTTVLREIREDDWNVAQGPSLHFYRPCR
jgi:hypothetical protein